MFTKFKKQIKRNYWFWYFIRNRKTSKSHQKDIGELNLIVDLLDVNGIATIQFNQIFKGIDWNDFKNEIYNSVNRYENNGKIIEHDEKSNMNFVLGLNPRYDSDSIWAKVAEHPNLKLIADKYFKMKDTQMRYYNIWKHEVKEGPYSGSQLWHRDREDVKILKVFICIEDVILSNGPFTYAPGTQEGGEIKKEPRYIIEKSGTKRTTDEMMNEIVPKSNWIKSVGKAGTVVFADTNGYHKGGEVTEGYRLLFTCMYVSPACERTYFE
jgi:hypothetical protein